ncbi:hypothetical protein GVX82_03250 [Patescibacteria group bacterium]|jgi:hypothetical protein|nr:hypothetical protein [Patescibacteria group bacterium]
MDEELQPAQLPRRIEWEGYEHEHREKTPDWFWGLALVTLAVFVLAIFFNNVLFAILVLIAGFLMALFALREPQLTRFALTYRGLTINRTLYPFTTLESFWIDDMDENRDPLLLIKSKRPLTPLLVIPVHPEDVDDVHEFLLAHLPEVEDAEPIAHKLFDLVGF